jgi:glutaredoxin
MAGNDGKIKLYGAVWCPDVKRSRALMDEKKAAYEWYDIDQDPAAKRFVAETNKGSVVIPTIVFPDGSMLVEPSNEVLTAKLAELGI